MAAAYSASVEVGTSSFVNSRAQGSPVRLRHAEELADDGEGQRQRERGDEVDAAIGPLGGDAVEEVVGDGLDM